MKGRFRNGGTGLFCVLDTPIITKNIKLCVNFIKICKCHVLQLIICLFCKKLTDMNQKKGRSRFPKIAAGILPDYPSFTFTTKITFTITFLFPLATAFFSCTKQDSPTPEEFTINIESKSAAVNSGSLDIFVYNLDNLRRLDSHSRQELGWNFPQTLDIGSRSGRKKIVALTNWPEEELKEWSKINSLDNISKITSYLATENPASPRMTGNATVSAGAASGAMISMQALAAKIKIATVCCDFSGKAYDGLPMQNARVYLTNVCVSTSIFPDDIPGTAFVNIGGYSQGDMEAFGAPDMLERNIYGDIGKTPRTVDIALYSYPAQLQEEGAGRPQTKLVLEGDIGGRRYYYPVRLGDYTGGVIRRDMTYQIDLRITKLGGDDPETPLSPDTFEATVKVLPWDETAGQTINY